MTPRQHLTPKERAALYEAQNGLCSCGCGDPLKGGLYHEEHTIALCLNGQSKPDALMLLDCHKRKTKRDVSRLAKLRRLCGLTKSQWHKTHPGKGKLKGRGFADSLFRRKFDGSVVRRQ